MTKTEHTTEQTAAHATEQATQQATEQATQPTTEVTTEATTVEAERVGVPDSGPWSIRAVPHRNGRAALEVYEYGELLDVMVASTLSSELLCGARRCVRGDRATGFAWGRLPADRSLPTVTFTGGRLSRLRQPTRAVALAGEFWLAWAEGPCGGVLVQHGSGAPLRLRPGHAVRAGRAR